LPQNSYLFGCLFELSGRIELGGSCFGFGVFKLLFASEPQFLSGLAQAPSEPSNNESGECGKKSAVPVNRVDSTERVTPHDFSDDEAILVWLGLCLILCPLAYTLTERATVFFFGPDKDNNGG
jgi:hypothetical protein